MISQVVATLHTLSIVYTPIYPLYYSTLREFGDPVHIRHEEVYVGGSEASSLGTIGGIVRVWEAS